MCTLRRWLCDADILPVTLNGDSIPVDVGRTSRTATAAQRLALRAMYPTCGFPHCSIGFDQCRIHHVTYWHNHGRSDLHNLLPLCEHHHHLVHEGGWTLTISKGRTLTIHRPDGTRHHHGTTHTQRPPPGRQPRPAAATGPPGRDDPAGAPATHTTAPHPTSPPHTSTSADLLNPELDLGEPNAHHTTTGDPAPESRDAERPAHTQAVLYLADRTATLAARRTNRNNLPDTG